MRVCTSSKHTENDVSLRERNNSKVNSNQDHSIDTSEVKPIDADGSSSDKGEFQSARNSASKTDDSDETPPLMYVNGSNERSPNVKDETISEQNSPKEISWAKRRQGKNSSAQKKFVYKGEPSNIHSNLSLKSLEDNISDINGMVTCMYGNATLNGGCKNETFDDFLKR